MEQDIKAELEDIRKSFEDKINEFRLKYFIDGEGLTLLNHSRDNEIKIGFAINAYSIKVT